MTGRYDVDGDRNRIERNQILKAAGNGLAINANDNEVTKNKSKKSAGVDLFESPDVTGNTYVKNNAKTTNRE